MRISSKWNILTGTWRRFPIPKFDACGIERIQNSVREYWEAVARHEAPVPLRSDDARAHEAETLRELHWRIDGEVLRVYKLPVEAERQLLDYFSGWDRVGVPFKQDRYFPEGFDEPVSLVDFLAITADWDATNEQRLKLMNKKADGPIRAEERTELQRLQRLAGLKRELLSSPSQKELVEMEADLRRRNLWRGA